MAVTWTLQGGPGSARQHPMFGNSRKCVSGTIDAAGDIADIWDNTKGGLKEVHVILVDGAGIVDYTAKTIATGTYPQRFVAFGT